MLHRWDLTPRAAVELQKELAGHLQFNSTLHEVRFVAGVDVAYRKPTNESIATIAVFSYPELQLVEEVGSELPTPFPYVPGLLSFREIPPVLEAFKKLRTAVDLVLVDGHGRAHPRRLGIASHLGLWIDTPTIGIGKSRLCGSYLDPGPNKGDQSDLVDKGEVIGKVLRSRTNVKPIFVSEGLGFPLGECVNWALNLTSKYRLPDPIHFADRLAAKRK